jgi:hypothetical protein
MSQPAYGKRSACHAGQESGGRRPVRLKQLEASTRKPSRPPALQAWNIAGFLMRLKAVLDFFDASDSPDLTDEIVQFIRQNNPGENDAAFRCFDFNRARMADSASQLGAHPLGQHITAHFLFGKGVSHLGDETACPVFHVSGCHFHCSFCDMHTANHLIAEQRPPPLACFRIEKVHHAGPYTGRSQDDFLQIHDKTSSLLLTS